MGSRSRNILINMFAVLAIMMATIGAAFGVAAFVESKYSSEVLDEDQQF